MQLIESAVLRLMGIAIAIAVILALLGLGLWTGALTTTGAADIGMAAFALFGLWLLVKLPWDLYFSARDVVIAQDESARRGLFVEDDDALFAARAARRLLLLSVGLHVVFASIALALARYDLLPMGYVFSVAYLGSMFFRPARVAYRHLKARLSALRSRAVVPREDAQFLRREVTSVLSSLQALQRRLDKDEKAADELRGAVALQGQRMESELDRARLEVRELTLKSEENHARVLRELERTVEKLTDNEELLNGLRAFVRLVKTA